MNMNNVSVAIVQMQIFPTRNHMTVLFITVSESSIDKRQ